MTLVKICGITNLEDALGAVEAGADALGFNFYEKSPRYIDPVVANAIVEKLPSHVVKVGVFVNSSVDEIAKWAGEFAQLHGDETPEFIERLRKAADVKVLKALRVIDGFDPGVASSFAADGFLLDTQSRGFGGSGKTFDWDIALDFKNTGAEFFLAGGLTPTNVADAIRKVRPYGVDVCSSVEAVKGKKDPEKVAAFIRNARSAL